jgi:hypothetical protein
LSGLWRALNSHTPTRARTLLREHLAAGPKPGAEIEVAAKKAAIPKPALLAATDKLGVRTQCGQWWLPG